MNIVILDGKLLNPGDVDWGPLEALGDLKVYDDSTVEQVPQRAAGADVVLINKVPLRRETLEQLPDVKMVGVVATGYDVVDVRAAGERGIPVFNVTNYGTEAVAQHAFALLTHGLNPETVPGPDDILDSVRIVNGQPEKVYYIDPLVSADPEFAYFTVDELRRAQAVPYINTTMFNGLSMVGIHSHGCGETTLDTLYTYNKVIAQKIADESLRLADKDSERINVPSNPRHYWRYRMHIDIEDLLESHDFNQNVTDLVKESGRM